MARDKLLVGWPEIVDALRLVSYDRPLMREELIGEATTKLITLGCPVWYLYQFDNLPRIEKGALILWAKTLTTQHKQPA